MDLSFMAAQVWDIWHYALKIQVWHEHQPVHFKAVQSVSLELKILIHPLTWFHFFWQPLHAFLYNLTSTRETGLVYWRTFLIFNIDMYVYLYLLDLFWLKSPLGFQERDRVSNCAQTGQDTKRDLAPFSNLSQHVIWTAPHSLYTFLWQLLRNGGLFLKKLPFK